MWAQPSANELARRRNARLRAAAQRQSAVRSVKKTPSPPKRKNSPKRAKTPSPQRVRVEARLPIARRVVKLPNGTNQVQYFMTSNFFRLGSNGKYNFTKPVKR